MMGGLSEWADPIQFAGIVIESIQARKSLEILGISVLCFRTGTGMISLLFSTWRIFTIFGTCHVRIHSLAPAIALWALVLSGQSSSLLFWTSLWMAALAHAFGHLLCARYYRQTPDLITLYPFYSTFRLDIPPAGRKMDLAITAAGPVLNLILGGVLYLTFENSDGVEKLVWVGLLARIQMTYGLLTLLPMYPLDGSRLLRLGLQFRYGLERSLEIATFLGQSMAATIVLWSFFQGFYWLGFAGIFLYVLSRFSTVIQNFVHRRNAAELLVESEHEETWAEGDQPMTMTMTEDGVWEYLEREPSSESRIYF